MMIGEKLIEKFWKETVMTYSKSYPGICLQGLRKMTK
jgi:hypothetical protein